MFKGTQTIDALDWEKEKPIYEKIIAKYDERAALSDPAAREAVDKEINDLTREAAQYAAGNEFSLLVDHMGGQGLNASTGYDQLFGIVDRAYFESDHTEYIGFTFVFPNVNRCSIT